MKEERQEMKLDQKQSSSLTTTTTTTITTITAYTSTSTTTTTRLLSLADQLKSALNNWFFSSLLFLLASFDPSSVLLIVISVAIVSTSC